MADRATSAGGTPVADPEAAERRALVGLLVVSLGTLAPSLDTSVNIALPAITSAFATDVRGIRWVVVSYVLTYSALMLIFGKIGDLYGHLRVFRVGLAVGAAGFVVCGAAPSYGWLLAGRILQGLGAALTLSGAPALVTGLYGETHRTRALALYGAMSALGVALGPIIGGALVAAWGWSAVFWFRAPIVLAGLVLSVVVRPRTIAQPSRRFDAPGAVLLAGWMVAGLLALAAPPLGASLLGLEPRWWLAGLAAIGLVAFLVREAACADPIVRPSWFRDLDFSMLNASSIVMHLVSFAILLVVPYYLVTLRGLPAERAGLVLAASAMGTVAGSWLAGRIIPALEARRVAPLGLALCAGGLAAIAHWQASTEAVVMIAALALQGLGVGLFQVAYADMTTAKLPIEDRGVAGSLTMVTRTIGTVSGVSILSAALERERLAALARGAAEAGAFLEGFQAVFTGAAVALAGVALAGLVLRPRSWL